MIAKILTRMDTKTPEIQGIIWMLIACFWFATMAIIIRYLTLTLDPFVIVFFRNFFSVICILPWAYKYGFRNIHTTRWKFYAFRTISGVIGMTTLFYAISIIPLTETIALTFTVPLTTTLLAAIFLGEKIQNHRWIALASGFLGVMIILRPGFNDVQTASLLVLVTTCCWSVSNILVKKLTLTDHPKTIVFLMMVIMTPCSLPAALYNWQTPDFHQFLWLIVLGWVSNHAQFAMTSAYSKTQMHIVLPFDFSRLVFISIMAYMFFGEVIDIWTGIGAVIIFISGFYLIRKERNKPVIDPSDSLV